MGNYLYRITKNFAIRTRHVLLLG